jgi:hypothetical protein
MKKAKVALARKIAVITHRMLAAGPSARDLDHSQVVGFIEGKSAIYIAQAYGERKRNFVGQSFWARAGGRGQQVGATEPLAL